MLYLTTFSSVFLTAFLLLATLVVCAQPQPGHVQTVLQLPNGDQPEGIAVDRDGTVYVGNRRINSENRKLGQILKIDTDGTTKLFAQLPSSDPSAEGLLGLAVSAEGDVFAAYVTFDPATHGVYHIKGGGKRIERLAASESIVFPNALTFDDAGQLYVTDSFAGRIWRFTDVKATATVWIEDVLLQPLATNPLGVELPGANGIAFVRHKSNRQLYVANTEKGMIVRIPIEQDRSSGLPHVLASGPQLLTVDGIAADVHGDIHAVIPGHLLLGTYPLIRVDGNTGETTPEVTDLTEIARFDVPLSVAFGRGRETGTIFITNGDLPIVSGGPGPGVVQVGVRVAGFHVRKPAP